MIWSSKEPRMMISLPKKWTVVIPLILAVAMIFLLGKTGAFGFVAQLFHNWVYSPGLNLFYDVLTQPVFYIVLGFTLLMERLFPAEPNKKILSTSFAQDLVWFFYQTIFYAIIQTTYTAFLIKIYKTYFNFLTIEAAQDFPFWVRFAAGVLILDFLYWLQHFIIHKVPCLWSLHTVHHSQKQLNFFTDFRYHALEYVVRETILVLPFLVLAIKTPYIIYFAIFQRWFTRFYHGNIRTNLGPLRYILVTPQSHRVHHSHERRHHDQNFGSLFCIWDQLLGTQYRGYDEYPETGINDHEFPHEKNQGFLALLLTPFQQMLYPFRSSKKIVKTKSLTELRPSQVSKSATRN